MYVKVSTYLSLVERVKKLENTIFKIPLDDKLKNKRIDYDDAVEIIIDTCSNIVGVDRNDVLKSEKQKKKGEKPRNRYLVSTRRLCYYFIDKYYPLVSLQMVGRKFGDRHHSTVLNSLREINNIIETNKEVNNQIEQIDLILKEKLIKKTSNEESSL